MSAGQIIISILAITIGVQITRFAPFLIFPAGRPIPKLAAYLGKTLPGAAISLLLVFSFKNVNIFSGNHGLPEFIAALTVAALHLWKRQMLISIGLGTFLYMALIYFIKF